MTSHRSPQPTWETPNWRGICEICHKRNYVDEIAAKLVIAKANAPANHNRSDVVPKRAYKCPNGKYYHLTHLEERSLDVG